MTAKKGVFIRAERRDKLLPDVLESGVEGVNEDVDRPEVAAWLPDHGGQATTNNPVSVRPMGTCYATDPRHGTLTEQTSTLQGDRVRAGA